MMAHKDTDLQKIKELIEIMKNNDLVEIEIKHGDDKIFLKRSQPQQQSFTTVPTPSIPVATQRGEQAPSEQATPTSRLTPQQTEDLIEIKSPIVGTFYEAPSPDSDPYVEVGSHVEPQTIVCIIEAMKVLNEIKADTVGTITEKLVKNGQAVEYGQVLFRVRLD
jgi:acetyl-CoA carboxylase biotin carboxyl carrier protein